MKREYFESVDVDGNVCYISTTHLDGFKFNEFMNAFYRLNDYMYLDKFTSDNFKDFIIEGFTEKIVKESKNINESDKMILFAYDSKLTKHIGLALVFNNKFYHMKYKEGRRSEDELYKIYERKR